MKKGTWQEVIFTYIELLCYEDAKKEEEKTKLVEEIKANEYLMSVLKPVLPHFGVDVETASQ